jgi:hypothetical protein
VNAEIWKRSGCCWIWSPPKYPDELLDDELDELDEEAIHGIYL